MRRILVFLLAVVFAACTVSAMAAPQDKPKKEKKAASSSSMKEDRWSGTILRSSKENNTLTVRKGNIEKTVVYDSSTRWTKGTADTDMKDFKDGARVIVMGKYDDKGRLMATRVDLRAPR